MRPPQVKLRIKIMQFLRRWLIKLIADDIRRGGEIAKALDGKAVQNLRQGRNEAILSNPSASFTVTGNTVRNNP